MMKSKDEIRKETPLSVTSTDNAIYETTEDIEVDIYDVEVWNGQMFGYNTLKKAFLVKGDKLRLLQCDDDEKDNHYRWGEANQKVIIPDDKMKYVSGTRGPRA